MVAHAAGFVLENRHFVRIDPTSGSLTPQKALLLGWERDTTAMLRTIVVVLLFSVFVGVLVGVVVHDATLGIAVSTGVAALLSCAELLVIWQLR